jgi:hypothetical protein
MTVLSLLDETQMLAVLELWPRARFVIAARWLDNERIGSGASFEDTERSCGSDQT